MSNYTNVKEFMQKFGQETPNLIKIPSDEIRLLRAKLVLEEALEVVKALGFEVRLEGIDAIVDSQSIELRDYADHNMEEILDGLVDLDVVGKCGTAIALGISEECLKEAEEEVSRSNLSKMWTEKEVNSTALIHIGTAERVSGSNDYRCFLVKDNYGKVIKSPSYHKANLKPLLERYGYIN